MENRYPSCVKGGRSGPYHALGAIDSVTPLDLRCLKATAGHARAECGRERYGRPHQSRSAGGKTLVQDPLCPGADRHPARRHCRLALARSRHQRLDQGARRRLHQADPDADRADHLLHGRFRHFPYPGRQQGRPGRRQGAGLFRDRLLLRADARPDHGQFGPDRPRACGEARCRRGRQLRQAGRSAEVGRFRSQHHPRQRGRRAGAR